MSESETEQALHKHSWNTIRKSGPAEFRDRGMLTDLVIRVAQEEFPVHKLILAMHSKYFFSYSAQLKHSDQMVVKDIEPQVFEEILDWIYHGQISYACFCDDQNSYETLLKSSDRFLLHEMVGQLLSNSMKCLDCLPKKCLWLYWFIETAQVDISCKIREDVEDCIVDKIKWSEVEHFEEFMTLDIARFLQILDLKLRSEPDYGNTSQDFSFSFAHRDIAQAILKWVQHDFSSRQTHLNVLRTKFCIHMTKSQSLTEEYTNLMGIAPKSNLLDQACPNTICPMKMAFN